LEREEQTCKLSVDILSLFPGYFKGPFDESIIKRAQGKGLIDIKLTDIRDFSDSSDRRVDDRPYGGGPGMVLMPGPVSKAIRSVKSSTSHVIYLSPQGPLLKADKCRQLAEKSHLILLCGHYEGIDQRALDSEVDEEISIGDYVLTNGCLAAIVLLDAVIRFIPGVLGHTEAAEQDSFEKGLLDCPHYTRPSTFEGVEVPEILLSGHHENIALWRREQALRKTRQVRPDLLL
jgi:tRNA (guanine37-N1)-methyltransferase